MTRCGNRLLTGLLAAMLLACFWTPALADTDSTGRFGYRLKEDGTAVINQYLGQDDPCVIPEQVDGYPVTGLSASISFRRDMEYNPDFDVYITTYISTVEIPATVTNIELFRYNDVDSGMIIENLFLGVRSIRVAEDNPTYQILDGSLYDKNTHELLLYMPTEESTSFAVPEGTRAIGAYAFMRGQYLTKLTLPNSLVSIGQWAFSNCRALSEITIPMGVSEIEARAFDILDGRLENIRVFPLNWVYEDVDGVLFSRAEKKLICYPAGRQAEVYQVPDGTRVIGENAFRGVKTLRRIDLPEGVERIEGGAFSVSTIPMNEETGQRRLTVSLPRSVRSFPEQGWWLISKDLRHFLAFLVYPGTEAEAYLHEHGYFIEYAKEP